VVIPVAKVATGRTQECRPALSPNEQRALIDGLRMAHPHLPTLIRIAAYGYEAGKLVPPWRKLTLWRGPSRLAGEDTSGRDAQFRSTMISRHFCGAPAVLEPWEPKPADHLSLGNQSFRRNETRTEHLDVLRKAPKCSCVSRYVGRDWFPRGKVVSRLVPQAFDEQQGAPQNGADHRDRIVRPSRSCLRRNRAVLSIRSTCASGDKAPGSHTVSSNTGIKWADAGAPILQTINRARCYWETEPAYFLRSSSCDLCTGMTTSVR